MNTAAELSSIQPLTFFSRRFGVSGLMLGALALLISIACSFMEEATHPPPKDLSHVLSETAIQIKDKLTKPEVPVKTKKQVSLNRVGEIFAALFGFVAAALGTASWARREDTRLATIAVGLGLAAIAWNFFLLAIISALALFLLAWILSQFE